MEFLLYSAICQSIVALSYVFTLGWALAALAALLNIWLAVLLFIAGLMLAYSQHHRVAPYLSYAGEALAATTFPAYLRVRALFVTKSSTT